MRKPAATDLLDLWERALPCDPAERALHLLALALPDYSLDALADFDLGLRDWHLLRLRRVLFGPVLAGYTDCPHCGERLEIELDAHALQDETPLPPAPDYQGRDGLRFRLPRCRDLIAITDAADADSAARELLARCCLDTPDANGAAMTLAHNEAQAFEEIDQGLAALAADRSLQLALACAVCGNDWQTTFDPGAFLWEEIHARATALLDEVHELARAYGWSEKQILALGDARRAAYLSRVN